MEFAKLENEIIAKPMEQKWIDLEKWRKRVYTEKAILSVDEYSLIVFPVSFTVFNAIYWLSLFSDLNSPVSPA